MKLSCVMLLALVTMVVADSLNYYESSFPEESPSNYYSNINRRRGRPSKKEGIIGKVRQFFGLGKTRRQFTAPTGTGTGTGTGTAFTGAGFTGTGGVIAPAAPAATGGGFPFLPFLLAGLAAAALAALVGGAFLFSQLNNSGRGLDTDEWEVDHSIWMDQLQKDFEDSWSQQ